DCKPDAAGVCRPSCAATGDERACIARADCEPVYVGKDCSCDAQGCACLDYAFELCRAEPSPPPPLCMPGGVTGTWSSDLAPRRCYTSDRDGSFSVSDAVAPCRMAAVCIWSGIVVNRGKWTVDAAGVVVTLAYQPIQTFDGLVFPTSLYVKSCLLVEADT